MAEWIQEIIDTLGYPGLAFLSFLETVFPPIPSEVIGPLAGFATVRGELTLIGVVIASMIGFLLGVLPLYLLGRFVGEARIKAWADKYGRWIGISARDIEKADQWFDKHGGKIVIASHLLPGIRTLISIPAGIARMNVFKFLLYTAIGKGLWTLLMVYLGRQLGKNYEVIGRYLTPISTIVIALIVVAIVVFIIRRRQQTAREV